MSLDSCQAYFCCSLGFEQLGKSKGSILSLALVLGLFGGYFLPDTFFFYYFHTTCKDQYKHKLLHMTLLRKAFTYLNRHSWIYVNIVMVLICTVSHFSYAPPFQGPHFLTKMLASNILYAHLLIDILSVWWHRKNIKVTHANHSAMSKAIFYKNACATWASVFSTCARNYPWWSLRQKNTQNNCFIQVKSPFLVAEVSNAVTFWRNASFDVILTSDTIIWQVFLRKLFCYESLVDIRGSSNK